VLGLTCKRLYKIHVDVYGLSSKKCLDSDWLSWVDYYEMARVIESWMAEGGYSRKRHTDFTKVEVEETEVLEAF
jgi:hypothetical protein